MLIPQLEEDGSTINKTSRECVVITPKGEIIVLKLGIGLCKGTSYINLRESHGFAMFKTICKNYEGFAKHKVQQAIQARKTQAVVAHLTDKSFIQMASNKNLHNSDIRV